MNHPALTNVLLFAVAFFAASITALKSGEHSARPAVKQLAEFAASLTQLAGVVFLLWALIRLF